MYISTADPQTKPTTTLSQESSWACYHYNMLSSCCWSEHIGGLSLNKTTTHLFNSSSSGSSRASRRRIGRLTARPLGHPVRAGTGSVVLTTRPLGHPVRAGTGSVV